MDGMQGGTGAAQTVFIEHAGIPTLPAGRLAAEALRDIGMQHEAQLVVSGYAALGTVPGRCHHCHTGMCPVGVTTQDPELSERLDPETGARWVTNYLKALTMELTSLARVPLAGTNWVPGGPG